MDDRVALVARYGVAYPAGAVAVVVVAGVAVGIPPTATGFATTIVAAVVGLVALHDPQSPRRRAMESARADEAEVDEEDVESPAASLAGHGGSRDPGDGPAPGRFDERSLRLLLFAVGLFVSGWAAFLLAG